MSTFLLQVELQLGVTTRRYIKRTVTAEQISENTASHKEQGTCGLAYQNYRNKNSQHFQKPIFQIISLFNLSFFHIFQIISLISSTFSLSFHYFLLYFPNLFTIQLTFFHNLHIFSLFNLSLFDIFPIFSLFSSIFFISFHNFLLYFPNLFTIQLTFLP